MSETLTPIAPQTADVEPAGEWMTMTEMESRYDGEWVLIFDPEQDENLDITAGRVMAHNKNRDKVFEYEPWPKPVHFACPYIGTIPEDVWYML